MMNALFWTLIGLVMIVASMGLIVGSAYAWVWLITYFNKLDNHEEM